MQIGQRVKNIRKAEKISAEDVASALGISVRTYRAYESDSHPFPSEHIAPLCKKLHITPNILFGEIDAEFSQMFAYVLENWNGDVVALINMLGAYAMQPTDLRRDTSELCIYNAKKSIEQGTADKRLAELVDIDYVEQALEKLWKG